MSIKDRAKHQLRETGESLVSVLYEQAKLGMSETEHLLPNISNSFWGGLLVYPLLFGLLVWLPLSRMRRSSRGMG